VEKVFGELQDVMSFLIAVCNRCKGLTIAKTEQKTKTCPYCGFKIRIHEAKKVASAENAYEASETLCRLKSDAVQRKKRP
jgi:DNA-directed RNA polymerase subunit RPC12/RpoP